MDEHSLDFFLSLQVRDEEGRRRFHGAFSGGYSAGYYNTVGSKEGIVTHSYGLECFVAFCLSGLAKWFMSCETNVQVGHHRPLCLPVRTELKSNSRTF